MSAVSAASGSPSTWAFFRRELVRELKLGRLLGLAFGILLAAVVQALFTWAVNPLQASLEGGEWDRRWFDVVSAAGLFSWPLAACLFTTAGPTAELVNAYLLDLPGATYSLLVPIAAARALPPLLRSGALEDHLRSGFTPLQVLAGRGAASLAPLALLLVGVTAVRFVRDGNLIAQLTASAPLPTVSWAMLWLPTLSSLLLGLTLVCLAGLTPRVWRSVAACYLLVLAHSALLTLFRELRWQLGVSTLHLYTWPLIAGYLGAYALVVALAARAATLRMGRLVKSAHPAGT
ncbi:MAG: hypothetical protein ACK47B_15310 [Armatimonadota bacterium]